MEIKLKYMKIGQMNAFFSYTPTEDLKKPKSNHKMGGGANYFSMRPFFQNKTMEWQKKRAYGIKSVPTAQKSMG